MTHTQFIQRLRTFGITIQVVFEKGTSNSKLHMNGHLVENEHYPVFGYRCGGAYNPCGRNEQQLFTEVDVSSAIQFSIDFLEKTIKLINQLPTYWSIQDFIKQTLIPNAKFKKQQTALKITSLLLLENFQELIKYSKEQYEKQ